MLLRPSHSRNRGCACLGACCLLVAASVASAEFANPNGFDNGADLRELRSALVGAPQTVAPQKPEDFEDPDWPSSPSTLTGEMRALRRQHNNQSTMQTWALAVLCGLNLIQIVARYVRP